MQWYVTGEVMWTSKVSTSDTVTVPLPLIWPVAELGVTCVMRIVSFDPVFFSGVAGKVSVPVIAPLDASSVALKPAVTVAGKVVGVVSAGLWTVQVPDVRCSVTAHVPVDVGMQAGEDEAVADGTPLASTPRTRLTATTTPPTAPATWRPLRLNRSLRGHALIERANCHRIGIPLPITVPS